jgi:hypothetical protein
VEKTPELTPLSSRKPKHIAEEEAMVSRKNSELSE